jgi:AcrR family transcriptional regulator
MTTAERTQSERQRRGQILKAARTVFDEKGYESATVSDIVRRAGVAQGTFYLYFESKKSVVVELARQPMADMALRLQRILTGNESFEQILRQFVHTGFDVGGENPDLCRLMHLGTESPQELDEFHEKSAVKDQINLMFLDAMDRGDMHRMDPIIASETFKSIMMGAMQLAFASENDLDQEQIKLNTANIIVRAFVTRPSVV